MKKPLFRVISVLIASTLFSSPCPVIVAEAAIVEGTADCSRMTITFGEYERLYGDAYQDLTILNDLSPEYYNIGDHLDANNNAVYDALSGLTEPSVDVIKVTLPEPLWLTAETYEVPQEPLFDAVFRACSSGIDALDHDRPEIFWIDQKKVSVGVRDVKYVYNPFSKTNNFKVSEIYITPAYYESFDSIEDILEYKQQLNETVAAFAPEGDTRYEKLKNIHDRIADFTYYDLEGKFSGSALSALVEPGAVCEGYAKGFKLICDSIGIPCVCVFGNYTEGSDFAHMWNYVCMEDGCWYAVDLTWDDRDGKDGVDIVYSYFLKGSEEFNTDHDPCEEYRYTMLKYPELAQWSYDYQQALTTGSTTTETTVTPSTTTVTDEPEYEYGDLNRDGKVSIADLVYCVSHVMGISEAEYSCDLNNDGRVDAYDVILMRQLVIETIEYMIGHN